MTTTVLLLVCNLLLFVSIKLLLFAGMVVEPTSHKRLSSLMSLRLRSVDVSDEFAVVLSSDTLDRFKFNNA